MKIESIRTHYLRAELEEPFAYSQMQVTARETLLVEVIDESGVAGWGECAGPGAVTQAAVTFVHAPKLIGRNPLQTEVLWQHLWQTSNDFARRGPFLAALSGLDLALWDLKGKLLGQPVSELLGGRFRDEVPAYATGLYFRNPPEPDLIDTLLAEAESYHEQGFRGLKLKVGKNVEFDLWLVQSMREQFPEATLMADANHAYDLAEALKVGKALEERGFAWFEEPVLAEQPELFAQLKRHLNVPLASGETLQTRYEFRPLIESGGIDFVQPDLSYCGGLTEALKIRAVANARGLNVIPHAWGTHITLAATVHFLASSVREPGRLEAGPLLAECDCSPNPLREHAFKVPLTISNGLIRVPTAPGLGIEVDPDALEDFRVQMTEIK